MTGQWGRMLQSTTTEVRLDEGRAMSSGAAQPSESLFRLPTGWLLPNFVAVRLDETENRIQQPGYPGDVGLITEKNHGRAC
jgi:hypothetical protein